MENGLKFLRKRLLIRYQRIKIHPSSLAKTLLQLGISPDSVYNKPFLLS